jgi:hypothetical protein
MWHASSLLTLTADEISSLQWEEVTNIETIAKKLENSFTWKDCPVECATLFHARVTKFMNDIILSRGKALGKVVCASVCPSRPIRFVFVR